MLTRRSGHEAATPLVVICSMLSTRSAVNSAFWIDASSCGSGVLGGGYTAPAGPVPFAAVVVLVLAAGAAGVTNVPSLLKLEDESPPPGVQGLANILGSTG